MSSRSAPTVAQVSGPKREFAWPVRVYYEDTDRGGVVYYANYLRYFERARSEWLRSLGVNQEQLAEVEGLIFVVARAEIDFKRGARLDEMLEATVQVIERKKTYLWLEQEVRHPAGSGAGRVCVAARIQAACVRRSDMWPRPLPAAIALAIDAGQRQ